MARYVIAGADEYRHLGPVCFYRLPQRLNQQPGVLGEPGQPEAREEQLVFGSPDDVVQCLENEVLSGVGPDQAIARRDGRHGHEARRFRGLPRQHRVGLTRRHLEDARRPQPGEEPAEPLRLGRVGDEGAVLAGGVKGPRLQVGAGHQRDTIVGHHELGVEVVVPADSDAALGHVFEALVVRLQVSGVRIFVRFGLG
jgi:hypothetical protein